MSSEIFQFENFKKFPELVQGISTTTLGNMSFNWGEAALVRKNRQKFFADLGVDQENVVVASLLHGHTILDATEADRGRGIQNGETSLKADILVTDKKGVFLFMVVADCLALFFYEPVKQVCALAHAGWKGVDQKVPALTVEYLIKNCHCAPNQIQVGMSPAIQAQSLRFPSSEVIQKQRPNWKPYLEDDGRFCSIDFTGFAYQQLLGAGIKPENIDRSTIDTRTSPDFYSHRRSQEEKLPEARFGCLIGLK